MRIIDADKFLAYLIFSKHIDGLTCGEVKEAIEMCKVDVLGKIRAEIEQIPTNYIEVQRPHSTVERYVVEIDAVLRVLDKYKEGVSDKE